MKKLLCLIPLLGSIALGIAAPKDDIEKQENAAFQAFKDKNANAFKKVVDHDIVAVYSDGIHTMADELADMPKWDVKSFTISDFKATSDEKDVIVTSYKVTTQASYEGKDMSGTFNAGTVWKIENGTWLAIFHTHVKAETSGTK